MQEVPIQAVPNQEMNVAVGGQQVKLSVYTLPQEPVNDVNTLQIHTANQEAFGLTNGQIKTFDLTGANETFQKFLNLAVYLTDLTGRHLQTLGVDYTVSGSNIIFTTAPPTNSTLDWVGSYTYYDGQSNFIPSSIFMDVAVDDVSICSCIPCMNLNKIVHGVGDFIGDFVFQDTQGADDPTYDGLGDRYRLQYLEAADL